MKNNVSSKFSNEQKKSILTRLFLWTAYSAYSAHFDPDETFFVDHLFCLFCPFRFSKISCKLTFLCSNW